MNWLPKNESSEAMAIGKRNRTLPLREERIWKEMKGGDAFSKTGSTRKARRYVI